MEQNTHKFRLRLNLFDGIVLVLVLAVGALLLWSTLRSSPAVTDSPAATASPSATPSASRTGPRATAPLSQEGDILVDNVRNYELGEVVSFEVVPAVSRQLDHEGRKYVQATYEGYEDILVTVEAPCTENDEAIVVGGGYEIRVGTVTTSGRGLYGQRAHRWPLSGRCRHEDHR